MSRNRIHTRSIITYENTEIRPKGITFNYYENFKRVIELTIENYQIWRTNVLYICQDM